MCNCTAMLVENEYKRIFWKLFKKNNIFVIIIYEKIYKCVIKKYINYIYKL